MCQKKQFYHHKNVWTVSLVKYKFLGYNGENADYCIAWPISVFFFALNPVVTYLVHVITFPSLLLSPSILMNAFFRLPGFDCPKSDAKGPRDIHLLCGGSLGEQEEQERVHSGPEKGAAVPPGVQRRQRPHNHLDRD